MLTTAEILRELESRNIPKTEIAKAINLGKSRVTELFQNIADDPTGKPRKLTHDEAVKLVQAFELEQDPPAVPLPASICRLLARHVARKMGVVLEENDPRLAALVADLQAFSRFVSEPRVRQSLEMAEGFFRAMNLLHSEGAEAAPPGTDPAPAH